MVSIHPPGLYRFYSLGSYCQQRLYPSTDVRAMCTLVSHLWHYGNGDDHLSLQQKKRASLKRPLYLSCGSVTEFCIDLFHEQNINCRQVHFISAQKGTQLDFGHILLEVKTTDQGWVLFDPAFKCFYSKKKKLLSAIDLMSALHKNDFPDIKFISNSKFSGPLQVNGADYSFWVDHRLQSPSEFMQWLQRIVDVVTFQADTLVSTSYHSKSRKAFEFHHLSPGPYQWLTPNEFKKKFYS
jgi:hypothetical protein